jgi:hypothetical protein
VGSLRISSTVSCCCLCSCSAVNCGSDVCSSCGWNLCLSAGSSSMGRLGLRLGLGLGTGLSLPIICSCFCAILSVDEGVGGDKGVGRGVGIDIDRVSAPIACIDVVSSSCCPCAKFQRAIKKDIDTTAAYLVIKSPSLITDVIRLNCLACLLLDRICSFWRICLEYLIRIWL